ncbi:MAG: ABC transporter substrate-binding protein [Nitriliruptorales bacterium]
MWLLPAALLAASCGGGVGDTDAEAAGDVGDQASPAGAEEDEAAGEGAADPVTLTFWNYWDGKNGEVMQSLVDEWNSANPDVQVESIFVGFGDLLPKLQAAVAGGEAPDVAAGDLVWLPKLTRSGRLVALDQFLDAEQLDEFFPEMLQVGELDGSTYSLPVSTNNLQLFYNRELIEQSGLDPDDPPETWDELRAAAAECADPASGRQGLELFTEPGEGLTWQFQVYLWQAGGEFLNEDGTAAAFNSPAGEQALQFWVDLIHDDKSAAVAPWGAFGQGNACMMMDGSWMVGIWSADPPFDFGTAPMPHPADGQPATNMGGEQIFIMADAPDRQQAAYRFVEWVTSHEVQLEWVKQTGFMPVLESLAADSEYRQFIEATEPRALPFVDGAQHARSRPPIPTYPEVSDAFSREIERALLGQVSVTEALKAAEQAVNDQIARG